MLRCDAEAVLQSGIPTVQADHRGADKSCVAEKDHAVQHNVKNKRDNAGNDLSVFTGEVFRQVPQDDRRDESCCHQDCADHGNDREDQEFLIREKNIPACLEQGPTIGQPCEHGPPPACDSYCKAKSDLNNAGHAENPNYIYLMREAHSRSHLTGVMATSDLHIYIERL